MLRSVVLVTDLDRDVELFTQFAPQRCCEGSPASTSLQEIPTGLADARRACAAREGYSRFCE
jgi:hypothetical protein